MTEQIQNMTEQIQNMTEQIQNMTEQIQNMRVCLVAVDGAAVGSACQKKVRSRVCCHQHTRHTAQDGLLLSHRSGPRQPKAASESAQTTFKKKLEGW